MAPVIAENHLPTARPWCLLLLGAPRLVRADPPGDLALSPKDAALLAIVALDGPVATDHVAALLWPKATGKRAESNLRQRLFRMRRDTGASLVSSGAGLRLAADLQIDLARVLATIATDENAGHGDLFGELAFDSTLELAQWVSVARRRWREQRNAALAAAAATCEAGDAVARGLVYARRLVEADVLSEHAHRRLMRLHYLRGDVSAALASFESLEHTLKHELGARPSAETLELLATIERAAVALPPHRAIVPASLLRPPRLIGREIEWALLSQAWGQGRAFALLGEAGVGKTRLLKEFAAHHDGVATVQARPGDAGMAYALLARLLRTVLGLWPATSDPSRQRALALVLPELGEPATLAGVAQRLLLLRAVEATLAEAASAGLRAVIVDDLHFADDASIEFLQSLTQSDSLSLLRWGFAQRPNEGDAAATVWRAALAEARGLESVTLAPLDLGRMTELIESLALPEIDASRLAPALLRHTGGNPMFALETLKHMVLAGGTAGGKALPQPASVGSLVERRLSQLSPGALKLARIAALAGASFSADLAAAVLEAHPLDLTEPWRELEAASVIRDGAFAHDLIFEATRASVPQAIAQLLHRRIAMHLRDHHAQAASMAPHWAGALEWALAGEAFATAARQARSASQRRHEVEFWRLAQHGFERAGDEQRAFDTRCERIQALIVVQGVQGASDDISALMAQAQTDAQRAAAWTARAMAALMAGDHANGVAAAVQAGVLARDLDSPWPRFEAARLHAVGLAQAGRAVEGLGVIAPFRDRVERDGDVEAKGHFWADYAYVLNTARRLRETAYALGQAIHHAQQLGDLAELATLTSNLATVEGNLGHADKAHALAERALGLQVQLGATDGPTGAVVETYVGLYSGMLGRYDVALERLDGALARFQRDGQTLWVALASNHKAHLLIELGQFARAQQALACAAAPVDSVRARSATMAARLDRALGHSGQQALSEALRILGPGGDPLTRMLARLDEAAMLEPQVAVERLGEIAHLAGELEFLGVVMKAELLRAMALHQAGQGDAAATLLRSLLPRLADTQAADLYPAQAWWIAMQVFAAQGADDEAASALAQGVRWIRQTALPHVPEPYRHSFLNRNPTNRALLAAANSRLQGSA